MAPAPPPRGMLKAQRKRRLWVGEWFKLRERDSIDDGVAREGTTDKGGVPLLILFPVYRHPRNPTLPASGSSSFGFLHSGVQGLDITTLRHHGNLTSDSTRNLLCSIVIRKALTHQRHIFCESFLLPDVALTDQPHRECHSPRGTPYVPGGPCPGPELPLSRMIRHPESSLCHRSRRYGR